MELTKQTLQDVKFRARGKWYSAQQVDAFLEELTVSVDEAGREKACLEDETQRLKREISSIQAEKASLEQELQKLKETRKNDGGERQRKMCAELEQERDELIQDIKALRCFRETFREAVEHDARSLLEQTAALRSEKLL